MFSLKKHLFWESFANMGFLDSQMISWANIARHHSINGFSIIYRYILTPDEKNPGGGGASGFRRPSYFQKTCQYETYSWMNIHFFVVYFVFVSLEDFSCWRFPWCDNTSCDTERGSLKSRPKPSQHALNS